MKAEYKTTLKKGVKKKKKKVVEVRKLQNDAEYAYSISLFIGFIVLSYTCRVAVWLQGKEHKRRKTKLRRRKITLCLSFCTKPQTVN